MHTLQQLERQQVGLRLSRYLVEQMDELAADYSLNRKDIIVEAIRSYVAEQQAERFYSEFAGAVESMKAIAKGKPEERTNNLDNLIDELEDTHT